MTACILQRMYTHGDGGDPIDAEVVYKVSLASPDTKVAPFAGEQNVAGSDNLHFNRVKGIAVDAAGNVYVSDNGNNRIQVFDGSGILLRTLRVTTPEKIFVHPVTGNIYCSAGDSVLKLSPEGTVLAGYRYQTNDDEETGAFCMDTRSDPPAVWVARAIGAVGYGFDRGAAYRAPRGSRKFFCQDSDHHPEGGEAALFRDALGLLGGSCNG